MFTARYELDLSTQCMLHLIFKVLCRGNSLLLFGIICNTDWSLEDKKIS